MDLPDEVCCRQHVPFGHSQALAQAVMSESLRSVMLVGKGGVAIHNGQACKRPPPQFNDWGLTCRSSCWKTDCQGARLNHRGSEARVAIGDR